MGDLAEATLCCYGRSSIWDPCSRPYILAAVDVQPDLVLLTAQRISVSACQRAFSCFKFAGAGRFLLSSIRREA